MKKIILVLSTLVLLIHGGVSKADRPLVLTHDAEMENVNEAEKYIGKKIKPINWGFLVTPKGDFSYLAPGAKSLAGTAMRDEQGRLFFLLTESQSSESGEKWDFVHSAFEIPKGLALGGKPLEDDCYVKDRPQEFIFVIGKTIDRYSKNGRYVGRFISPVIKAWRVDFTAKKLLDIPTKDIHCEIDINTGAD